MGVIFNAPGNLVFLIVGLPVSFFQFKVRFLDAFVVGVVSIGIEQGWVNII